jgi:Tol biopolymer transport system component
MSAATAGKMAFTSMGEVYLIRADGTGRIRLTSGSAVSGRIAWSPDGPRIAFASTRDGNWEIYVMNADGTGLTRLTFDSADDLYAAWSP